MLNPTTPKDLNKVANEDGFLGRLRGDERGNALAIMAMALFPLAGLVGGGVDMSRLYLAKSRLQQACDAGALAGRKVMGGQLWTANSNAAPRAAEEFFKGNFKDGAYGTKALTKTFAESAGKVTGAASVTVPMTIMRIFGTPEQKLAVTCEAELRLPNTDIVFVLDTTGSMNDKAVSTDTTSKIVGLKTAVKCFYETVARLDTDAVCGTGPGPSGGTGTQTQVRFGFVPYATNVNVGRLLPTEYFADEWTYQSRKAARRSQVTHYDFPSANGTPGQTGSSVADATTPAFTTISTTNGVNKDSSCAALKPADAAAVSTGPQSAPYEEQSFISGSSRTVTWKTRQPHKIEYEYNYQWNSTTKVCVVGRRIQTHNLVRTFSRTDSGTPVTQQVFDKWNYAPHLVNVGQLKNGTSWNASFSHPIGNTADGAVNVSNKTISWDGCIEERATIRKTNYTALTATERADAKDLDIDLVPSATVAGSRWGPALPGLVYTRATTNWYGSFTYAPTLNAQNYAAADGTTVDGNGNVYQNGYYCPSKAETLKTWPNARAFENVVDGLTTGGNTYHDIGLIWGARFISPTGLFKSTNALTPGGGEIDRHIIFMTDGATCTATNNYAAYGVPWFDRRQTAEASVPTSDCSAANNGTLDQQVNARFTALCTTVKNMPRTTLWVVYYGTTDATTTARMTNCATSGSFKNASNTAALIAEFQSIADKISQLRLTQ